MADVVEEPVRGAIGDPRLLQTAGLETFKKFIRGELPDPPISRLLGFRATEAGLGKATFAMPVTCWLEDGFGLYWGGVYALLADAPLAWAIWTTLPPGRIVTTSELNLSFVRPMSRKTSGMVGRAETVHSGNQVGLSMVQITDPEGRLLAFGSSRCLITDVAAVPGRESLPPASVLIQPDDPYLRPGPDGGYFSLDEVLHGTPIELQRRTLAREPFPVWRLTGYRPTIIEDGHVEATLPSSAWFSNSGPAIYGGLLAWAAEFTMGASVYSTLSAGDVFATLDMQIRFLRPALIDSGPLKFSANVRHRGRRLLVTSCDVDNAEGKRVAMATSSALAVPGGAGELTKGRLPEEILASAGGEGGML